jgi:hypothetical protein
MQRQMISEFNRSQYLTGFPPGSHIMVKDMGAASSLDASYDGHFMVVRDTTHGTYARRNAMGRLLARNYAPEQLKLAVRTEDPNEAADTHGAERILGHCTAKEERTRSIW